MSQVLPERRGAQERGGAGELQRLRQMLDQTFGGFGFAGVLGEPTGWAPAVDIEEQENAYLVEAELPGVKPEDVNIELAGNELAITGEIDEQEEREGVMRRRARRRGRFEYRVILPDEIDAENIDANLSDGILRLRIPKSEQAQRRRIEVQSS